MNKTKNSASGGIKKWSDKALKVVNGIGQQKELGAIRDTFALMLPLIVAGAIGILGVTFFFGGWGAQTTSILGWIAKASGGLQEVKKNSWEFIGTWKTVSRHGVKIFSVLNSVFDYFSIFAVFILGYTYAKVRKSETPILGAGVALGLFLVTGGSDSYFYGSNGLLSGLIVTLTGIWIFTSLQKSEKIKIKMPNGVPPAVGKAFSALIPIILTLLIFAGLNYIFWTIGYYSDITIENRDGKTVVAAENSSFISMFFKGVTSPFISFVGSSSAGLGILILYLLFVGFFWWCGIHGSNVLNGIFYPIWMGIMLSNTTAVSNLGSYNAAYDAGKLSIVAWGFIEQFTMVTGWGLTGMLVLSGIIFSRNPLWKQVNKVAAPAAIFNINEPVTYGYPVMLNPVLLTPTMLAMPIAGTMAYLATDWGWLRISHIYVPWTMPAPIGAMLTTGMDWRAIPIVFVILGVIFALYTPFIFLDNKIQKNAGVEGKNLSEKVKAKISKK